MALVVIELLESTLLVNTSARFWLGIYRNLIWTEPNQERTKKETVALGQH